MTGGRAAQPAGKPRPMRFLRRRSVRRSEARTAGTSTDNDVTFDRTHAAHDSGPRARPTTAPVETDGDRRLKLVVVAGLLRGAKGRLHNGSPDVFVRRLDLGIKRQLWLVLRHNALLSCNVCFAG